MAATVLAPVDTTRADYLAHLQYTARQIPEPKFGPVQDVRGGNTRPARTVAYSLDGKRVATGCDQRGLRIWDARKTMDTSATFMLPTGGDKSSPHYGHIGALAWSPADPHVLATGDRTLNSAVLAIWDVRAPKAPIFTHKFPHDILHMSFHPDGAHLVVVCPRGTEDEAFFFHRRAGEKGEQWALREDVGIGGADKTGDEINALRFSHSGKFLLSVSNDGSLNAWEYPLEPRSATYAARHAGTPLPDPGSPAIAPEASPSVTRVPSPEPAPSAEIPPPADASSSQSAEASADPLGDIEMNGDGASELNAAVLTNGADGVASSAGATAGLVPPPTPASVPAIATTTATTAPATELSPLQRARARQLRRIKHAVIHSASLLAMDLDPSGRYVAVGGADALLSIVSTRDWICVRKSEYSVGAIRLIAFSPDGEMVAFGGDDSFIYIISVVSGQLLHKQSIVGSLQSLAWHPSHNWLGYVASSKGPVVWFVLQQQQQQQLQ